MDSLERRPRHGRTAAEAIVQADAKFKIFSAISVRMTGLGIVGFGFMLLARPSTWRLRSATVAVHLAFAPQFIVSVAVLISLAVVVVGAGVVAIGQWQFRRSVRAARENPVAAPLFEQLMPPGGE